MPPHLRSLPLVALAVGSLLVGACTRGVAPEVANNDPVLVEGRDIYVRQCSSCHGLTGAGGRGSKLNEERVIQRYPSADAQLELIRDGRNQMPAFGDKLDDDQLDAVVRYTREVLATQG